MVKAYDRVKNADQRTSDFIRTPYWNPEVEDQYVSWMESQHPDHPWAAVQELLDQGVAVSFKPFNGSWCTTLANQELRDKKLPHLISGWSDEPVDALFVARFKLRVLLDGSWESDSIPLASKRH